MRLLDAESVNVSDGTRMTSGGSHTFSPQVDLVCICSSFHRQNVCRRPSLPALPRFRTGAPEVSSNRARNIAIGRSSMLVKKSGGGGGGGGGGGAAAAEQQPRSPFSRISAATVAAAAALLQQPPPLATTPAAEDGSSDVGVSGAGVSSLPSPHYSRIGINRKSASSAFR